MKALKNVLVKWLGVEELQDQFQDLNKDLLVALERVESLEDKLASNNSRLNRAEQEVGSAMKVFNKYLRADVDVDAYRGDNTIVLTGMLRGKGYVQFYDLSGSEFTELVERMRDMRKCSMLRTIDAPPHFRGTFDI